MLLLVGGDSEIGAATFRALRARGIPVAATTRRPDRVAPDRPFLDLALPLDDWTPPPGTRAACIFAAVARLAACENDPAGSAQVNVTQTAALIERLIAHGVALLFCSSDKVFAGTRPQMPADAPVAPNCEYGRQKAAIEALLRSRMDRADAAILRLSKVVAPDSALFAGWIVALREGRPVRAFTDLMFAPVPIAIAVDAVAALLEDRARGIFQLSGPRDISYSAAAHFLARRLRADEALIADVSARDGGQPPGAAAPYTSLDSSALGARYGIAVPDAWEVLGGML